VVVSGARSWCRVVGHGAGATRGGATAAFKPARPQRPVVTELPDIDPTEASAVAERRDEVVAAVREHATQVAYQVARLQGGDYGSLDLDTDAGTWTVKHEAGELDYLRFDPDGGDPVYVVSTERPPEPEPLATAMADYGAFLAAYEAHVDSLDGVLEDVPTEFPEVATTDGVVAERDRVVGAVADACDRMAAELRRADGGDYGTFTARVDGERWELNWDRDGAAYLRVGGEDGVYLLSQYGPPSARELRAHAPSFPGFVRAYNDHVESLAAELRTVEL